MGKRRFPPLTPAEVRAILVALRFSEKNQEGDHVQYERLADGRRQRAIVTVDTGVRDFDEYLVKSMIRQSGFTRDEFYGATKRTARRADVPALGKVPEPEEE